MHRRPPQCELVMQLGSWMRRVRHIAHPAGGTTRRCSEISRSRCRVVRAANDETAGQISLIHEVASCNGASSWIKQNLFGSSP